MSPRHRVAKPRLLVIDDDPGLCDALTTLLEDEFQVATTATGAEGLALIKQTAIPVVLLELSAAMRRTWEALLGVADTTTTVLLLGETGTGKELVWSK